MISAPDLVRIMPRCTLMTAGRFWQPLSDAMTEFAIDSTNLRQATFLAQVAHESGELRYVEELASGDAYEGRRDLGNTQPGDGPLFKGRGLLQVTGRANYLACSLALFADERLLTEPTLLTVPQHAAESAGWFWASHGLNQLADTGDFEAVTRRINGGLNGYDQRLNYWRRAKAVYGVTNA